MILKLTKYRTFVGHSNLKKTFQTLMLTFLRIIQKNGRILMLIFSKFHKNFVTLITQGFFYNVLNVFFRLSVCLTRNVFETIKLTYTHDQRINTFLVIHKLRSIHLIEETDKQRFPA